jgi:DNA-binding NtrC family response regulator
MARILISESHDDVRRLLERMVLRLGHEPVAVRAPTPQQLTSADVFLVEPAAPIGAVLAQAAHLIDPTLPLICASVTAPPPELAELGISFTATLVKPFTLDQLAAAIERALCARRASRDERERRRRGPDRGDRAA